MIHSLAARVLEAREVAARGLARLARDLMDPRSRSNAHRAPSPFQPPDLLCPSCFAAIPRLAMPICAHCLARGREPVGCIAHPGRVVWPAWVYDERAALVVHAIKYGERPALARTLGDELARALPALPRPDLVTGVPLHPVRRRERGYNQAALLADALADSRSVMIHEEVLERVRAHAPAGAARSQGAKAQRGRCVSDAAPGAARGKDDRGGR